MFDVQLMQIVRTTKARTATGGTGLTSVGPVPNSPSAGWPITLSNRPMRQRGERDEATQANVTRSTSRIAKIENMPGAVEIVEGAQWTLPNGIATVLINDILVTPTGKQFKIVYIQVPLVGTNFGVQLDIEEGTQMHSLPAPYEGP